MPILFQRSNNLQTFLPWPDYKLSAKCLDNKRLAKQRVEGLQILNNLLGCKVIGSENGPSIVKIDNTGWNNHPVVHMWENNINSLAIYTIAMCDEWMSLGFKDTIKMKIGILIPGIKIDWKVKSPSWLGDSDFHASHRSNLLRKDERYYRQLGWTESTNLPYIWPKGK